MLDGMKLYELRRGKGVSQDELAAALNVTRQTVSKWENDLMPISADKQKELAEFFGVADLFFDEVAATASGNKACMTANQKIIVAVIAALAVIALAVTVVVGCVSVPNLWADEKGATSLYVDIGYFWLALCLTFVIVGLDVFAFFMYRKENIKKMRK